MCDHQPVDFQGRRTQPHIHPPLPELLNLLGASPIVRGDRPHPRKALRPGKKSSAKVLL